MKALILAIFAYSLTANPIYREAEQLEKRLLFPEALAKYQELLGQKSRLWKRRAAYRITTLIRDIHFSAGRSESVRPYVISVYKSLLLDLPSMKHDPELWAELHKEIRWTRLGLQSPQLFL